MDSSEAYRQACEVRWLSKQPEAERISYCRLVEKHRGREAAKALYRAALLEKGEKYEDRHGINDET